MTDPVEPGPEHTVDHQHDAQEDHDGCDARTGAHRPAPRGRRLGNETAPRYFAIDDADIDLAMLAALVMTGWNKVLVCTPAETAGQRAAERDAHDWWIAAARRGLEHWSP